MSTLLNELEQFEFLGTSYEVSRIAEFIEKKIQVAVNSEKERIREDLEKSNLLVIDALETYKVGEMATSYIGQQLTKGIISCLSSCDGDYPNIQSKYIVGKELINEYFKANPGMDSFIFTKYQEWLVTKLK